ncbi:nickel/cobalt transporter [Desulfonatronovibrio magnus]|uniref:nickel/cobalt transporter n=1 Tax=Desulfonatronovibrio magnus TaxID=698827 RepID=UPI0006975855|nr:nickel/cobalt transporter [Desulfonatronovibrio magnus]
MKYFFLLLLFLTCCPQYSLAQNPFQGAAPAERETRDDSFSVSDLMPEWIQKQGRKAMVKIIAWQAQIRQKAGVYARDIRENPWGASFWSFIGLAFAYGVIHALGPGHGKVFVSTYFLSTKAKLRQGLLMGGLMSFLHVLSAVALVLIFYFVTQSGSLSSVDEAEKQMQKISSALIFFIGLFLAWKSIRAISGRAESCKCSEASADNKGMLSLCLAVGMIPCPGAALILFFAISLDIFNAGLIAMLFLAAGLALTTISFALASIFARNILARAATNVTISPRLFHVPALAGALIISFLGATLYFSPGF